VLQVGFLGEKLNRNKVENMEHILSVNGKPRVANSVRHATPEKYKAKLLDPIKDPMLEFEEDIRRQQEIFEK